MLCLLAYVPSLFLPLLEDDYANIWTADITAPGRIPLFVP